MTAQANGPQTRQRACYFTLFAPSLHQMTAETLPECDWSRLELPLHLGVRSDQGQLSACDLLDDIDHSVHEAIEVTRRDAEDLLSYMETEHEASLHGLV